MFVVYFFCKLYGFFQKSQKKNMLSMCVEQAMQQVMEDKHSYLHNCGYTQSYGTWSLHSKTLVFFLISTMTN